MKYTLRITALLLVFLLGASLLLGCKKDDDELPDAPVYSATDISECVRLGEYKNMTVDATQSELSADVALWNKIVSNAEIVKYPESAVAYYKGQAKQRYKYHAEEGGMSYDELLASLEISEEDILAEAKGYVRSDLVKLAIIEAEGLHLTDDEKTRLFDKYAYKFSTTYGYSDEYVRKNLSDEIYEVMQYDKMMEFLMLNNTVKKVTEE